MSGRSSIAARAAISSPGPQFEAPELAAGLYVVATPIGNLRDITIRGLETLAAADVIYCEDTRTSAELTTHFGIDTPRKALHEHNERALADAIADDIGRGGRVALISDAGTPLLSDPGFPLVRAVREAGLPVFAAPGASALLAALAVAGLPTDAFSFAGFLPPKAEGAENGAHGTQGPARDAGVLRIARAGWARASPRWPRSLAPTGWRWWRWS